MKPQTGLVTTGQMAKTLGASDGRVKQAIKELGITPKAKKGVCNYYALADQAKIKKVLQKAG